MARGRKPKAPHLKLIDGNPGKRKIELPRVAPSRPIAPPELSPEAKREWQYVVPRLDALGMLNKVDRTALAIYCEEVATYWEAIRMLRQSGALVRGDKGRIVKNPAAQIARDAATQIRLYCAEFGLTASSRLRMQLPETPAGADPLEDILGGHG